MKLHVRHSRENRPESSRNEYESGQGNHVLKTGQESVFVSLRERIDLWLGAHDLSVLHVHREKEATIYHKILLAVCRKILCIDSAAPNVTEVLAILRRADSGRVKEWRSAEPGRV